MRMFVLLVVSSFRETKEKENEVIYIIVHDPRSISSGT